MSGNFGVGTSSYDDLRGVEQFVASERMALQILSVKVDFDQWKADQGSGDRLSINEAKRSRARQSFLWANRVALGVAVASPFTSRHDEIAHGNAIDIGVTMADGRNRALTADEFNRVHGWVEQRGGTWTGVNFGEPWHHEMATRTERLPPYPNARALVAAGPTIQQPEPSPEDLIMHMFQVKGGGIFLAGPQFLTHYDDGAAAARDASRFAKTVEVVELAEAQRILGVFHVPWNYADAKQFRKAAPTGQWDSRGAVKAV